VYFNDYDSNSSGSDDPRLLAEINIIPLVDVMLVLLIVFMVAAPLSLTAIKVNLPASKVKKALVKEPKLILSIDKKGDYYLLKAPLPKQGLKDRLELIFKTRKTRDLFINADKEVMYGNVIEAMSAAKEAGVHKISMMTKLREKI